MIRAVRRPWFERLLAIPLRAPRLTLAVMGVLTLGFGFFAWQIRVDSSIENLLPAHDADRRYYETVRNTFGSEEILVIGVFAEDIFTPETLGKIDRLSRAIAALDGVQEVLSLTTVKGVESEGGLVHIGPLLRELPQTREQADALRERVLGDPLYRRNLVSLDSRGAGISVIFEPEADTEAARNRLDDAIRSLVASLTGPERFAITGIPTLKVNGARLMERDTELFTPLALLLVVIVLFGMFRTWRGVLIPLATVVVGVVWTNGIMVLAGSAITMGTLVLNPLLMVVGIASAIHFVSQYYWELRPQRTRTEVVAATMEHVRVPVMIAGLTTLIGFATLIFTPVVAVREFGMYAVAGIAVTITAAFAIIPALLSLLPLPRVLRRQLDREGHVVRLLQGVSRFSIVHRRLILACGAAVLLLSVWGISRIRVDTDYIGFFSPNSPLRKDNALISSHLAGTQPVYLVIEAGGPREAVRVETLAAIRDLQEFVAAQPSVDTTISVVDYLRLLRNALQPDAPSAEPETQKEVDQLLLFVNPGELRPVLSRDLSRANIIVRTRLSGSTEVGSFVERVERFAAERFPRDVRVRATGNVVLLNRSADALVLGQIGGLWQELTALLLLLAFLFLSIRVGLLALVPNVFPTIILFGIMGWSGVSLNVSTSMIAAIAIGIAIDDTIHLLTSFNTALRRSGNQEEAVVYAIRSAGQAAVFISTALAAGFFIVCLSSFQPVRHFGLLAGVTMLVALVVELFFTPALLATTKIVTLWDLLYLKLGPEPHREIPLFAGLRPFQAKIVVLMAYLASVRRGSCIARQGEMKAELYVLLTGQAEVRRAGDAHVLKTLRRGDVTGEMGLVRGRPRSADVWAVDDTEYLVLDSRFLQRLRLQYPRIAATVFLNLTRILSDRLESTTDQLLTAVSRSSQAN